MPPWNPLERRPCICTQVIKFQLVLYLQKLGEKILSKKGQFLVNFFKNIFDNRCRYKNIVVVSLLNAKITLKQETSFRPKKIRIFLLSPTQFITIQDIVTQVFLCTLNLKCCYTLKIKVLLGILFYHYYYSQVNGRQHNIIQVFTIFFNYLYYNQGIGINEKY